VAWNERGIATSSIMFMHIVAIQLAAVFGAIPNFGINRRISKPAIPPGIRVHSFAIVP
jgi:hypothetical protein